MAFTTSESMTLMVNGTCASELRTRFWPMRFTYSFTTGSWTSFTLFSTCIEYCLPILISVSSEYQFPRPRPPTLRLPMASTSSSLPSCLTWLSGGSWTGAGPLGVGSPLALAVESCAEGEDCEVSCGPAVESLLVCDCDVCDCDVCGCAGVRALGVCKVG